MYRGALILGIGFSLGYAKALQDSADIKNLLVTVVDLLKEETEKRNAEREKQESSQTGVVVDADAVAVPVDQTPEGE